MPLNKGFIGLGILMLGASGCTLSSKEGVSLEYYSINGNSLKQIDREIRTKGPKINGVEHAVAISNIKMTPDIILSSTDKGCVISQARIKVNAVITLPRWTNRRGANPQLANAWDNLDRYTRLHEAVHVSIAKKYAKRLETRLKSLKTGKSCASTGQTARGIIDRTMVKHEREQLRFDATEKSRFARLTRRNRPS